MSATIIALIISLLFVLILVGGFLVGFWRGLKRSLINTIFCLAAVLIAFFLTPTITKAILKIKSPNGQGTLGDFITQSIMSIGSVGSIIKNNPNLKNFINLLPAVIVNTVMFILVTLVLEFVAYIIFKILGIAIFDKSHKGRVWGGVVGVVKAFVVTLLACMPLAGLIGVANNLTKSNDFGIQTVSNERTVENKGLMESVLPSSAKTIIKGLEGNFLIKCCGVFGLDNAMFDYYGKINIDGKKVVVSQELNNYYTVGDFVYQLTNLDLKNVDYTKLDYTKLKNAMYKITDSAFFDKIIADSVSDIVINYPEYTFLNLPDQVKDVFDEAGKHLADMEDKSEYFKNDIKSLFETFRMLGRSGLLNEVIADRNDLNRLFEVCISDDNIETIKDGVATLLNINLVRDSIPAIVKNIHLNINIDKIEANTDEFTEDDWTGVTESLHRMINLVGDLAKCDAFELINNPLAALENRTYNIPKITSTLGGLVDEIRANKLLRNTEDKPIIDKFLESKNLLLPSEEVVKNDGTKIKLDNYTKFCEFVSPSLSLMQENGVYNIFKDNDNVIEKLANLLCQEGNENLLSDILLPIYQAMYQIDIVKDNVFDKLNSMEGNLIDFSVLNNYNDWKEDLGHISKTLISLNTTKFEGETLLSYALNENYDKILNNLTDQQVDDILGTILVAKSTNQLKRNIFASLEQEINKFTETQTSLNIDNVSFTGNESQTKEICDIIKKYISYNKDFHQNQSLRENDLTKLGELLDTMKLNAYRKPPKTEEGVFKEVFESIAQKLQEEYRQELEKLESLNKLNDYQEVKNLKEGNYSAINFSSLFTQFEQVKNLIEGSQNGI